MNLPTQIKQRLPNWLTISRVVVILPIALLLYFGETQTSYGLALALTLYAVITDFFDGYLSRRWHATSDFGRLLDPVADKLLVAALLVLLCTDGLGHPLAVTAIILREIFISALREFMQERQVVIHVTKLAKYKTTTQMIACLILLIAGFLPSLPWIATTGDIALWLAALLTWITGIDYIRGAVGSFGR